MDKVKAYKLTVPFDVLKPARVSVWLIPSTEVDVDVPLAVLVDVDEYCRFVLPGSCKSTVPVESLVDRREWASQFGVTAQGRLVSYADLSRLGWGLQGSSGRASYWTVFFAQNVMRGLCMRLIGCEMSVLQKDAAGEEVYFKPWVKMLRQEVKAYKRIAPVRNLSRWADEVIKAMWKRVGAGLTLEVNTRGLAFEHRQSKVVEMNRAAQDAELAAKEVTE